MSDHVPEWVHSSYPAAAAARAAIVWKPEGELCACGRTLHIGRFDGREVAKTCFRCGVKKFVAEKLIHP